MCMYVFAEIHMGKHVCVFVFLNNTIAKIFAITLLSQVHQLPRISFLGKKRVGILIPVHAIIKWIVHILLPSVE